MIRKTDAEPTGSAADFLPAGRLTFTALREAADGCRGCELFRDATQTVFGEGPVKARLMFVGEKTGDQEDRQGRPFVGPAGQLLQRALDAAGIDRKTAYVTNMVSTSSSSSAASAAFTSSPAPGRSPRAGRGWTRS